MEDRKARDWMGELVGRTGASALALLFLGLGVTGCHKKQKVAYRQPPPPVIAAPRSAEPSPSAHAENNPQPLPEMMRGRPSEVEVGLASWYGPPYAGRRGADGS